jgi:hypothetical protein
MVPSPPAPCHSTLSRDTGCGDRGTGRQDLFANNADGARLLPRVLLRARVLKRMSGRIRGCAGRCDFGSMDGSGCLSRLPNRTACIGYICDTLGLPANSDGQQGQQVRMKATVNSSPLLSPAVPAAGSEELVARTSSRARQVGRASCNTHHLSGTPHLSCVRHAPI